jgi:hypothetical protein
MSNARAAACEFVPISSVVDGRLTSTRLTRSSGEVISLHDSAPAQARTAPAARTRRARLR